MQNNETEHYSMTNDKPMEPIDSDYESKLSSSPQEACVSTEIPNKQENGDIDSIMSESCSETEILSNGNYERNSPSHDRAITEPLKEDLESVTIEKPKTVEEERRIVKDLEARANLEGFKENSTWFLLSSKWYDAWKRYVGYDGYKSPTNAPGEIDNQSILEPSSVPSEELVRSSVMENTDFVIVSESMWRVLQQWYGGGPPLPRKVIKPTRGDQNTIVEIRPLTLLVHKSSAIRQPITVRFSKVTTIGEFKEAMCQRMNLNPQDVQVWDYHNCEYFKLLEDMNQRLGEAQIIENQDMLLEERDADGNFPEHPTSSSSFRGNTFYSYNGYGNLRNTSGDRSDHEYGYGRNSGEPGRIGLSNLGNTCFMNSSLQCLSATSPLTEYFLEDRYRTDLNPENPLGMKGELAEEYAALLRLLWPKNSSLQSSTGYSSASSWPTSSFPYSSSSYYSYGSSIAPRNFKWKLEGFAPQFAGYQQHDSQELLAFLLDGLHEDLNRIRKKPYVEVKEVDGQPLESVAEEHWALHRSRNDSIIVDWFQGQLKSTLVCPVCNRVSITFDPFMYLSLPLPTKNTKSIAVTLFFLNPLRMPTKFLCEVEKFGTIRHLKNSLGNLAGINPEAITLADVYNSKFFKVFLDSESLESIRAGDIICGYEILLPSSTMKNDDDPISEVLYFPVSLLKEEELRHHSYYPSGHYTYRTAFGIPFILSVPVDRDHNLTYRQLYELISYRIQRYLRTKLSSSASPSLSSMNIGLENSDTNLEEDSYRQSPMIPLQESSDTVAGTAGMAGRENDINTNNSSSCSCSNSSSSDNDNQSENENDHKPISSPESNEQLENSPMFVVKLGENTYDQEGLLLSHPENGMDQSIRLSTGQSLAACFSVDTVNRFYKADAEREFEEHPSSRRRMSSEQRESNQSVTLQQCIELFTATEKLGPDDPWYCSRCQQFQQATKKFDLWRLPSILVIHLKRFSYQSRYWREKLETFVQYPLCGLDLSPFVKGPFSSDNIYDLYAVSNHFGSLGGGHYTAFCKHRLDNHWYRYDDSYVEKINESEVVSSSAYVLFYRRRDCNFSSSSPSSSLSVPFADANDPDTFNKDLNNDLNSGSDPPTNNNSPSEDHRNGSVDANRNDISNNLVIKGNAGVAIPLKDSSESVQRNSHPYEPEDPSLKNLTRDEQEDPADFLPLQSQEVVYEEDRGDSPN